MSRRKMPIKETHFYLESGQKTLVKNNKAFGASQ